MSQVGGRQGNKKKVKLTRIEKFQRFLLETKRIFKNATKPNRKQYKGMVKICSIGILIIGLLSFVIQVISTVIQG